MNKTDRCIVKPQTDCDGVPYPWREVFYFCPGCKEVHSAPLDEAERKSPKWTWDGNTERPTISPSVNYTTRVCHHFVRNGRIEFCGDSTHALSGQSADLPTLGEWPLSSQLHHGVPQD